MPQIALETRAPVAGLHRFLLLSAALAGILVASPLGAQTMEDVAIHGFLSQGYMGSQHYDYLAGSSGGTFQFSEMGINFSSEVGRELRIGAQFFARDLGSLGNNAIELDWAYGDYSWQDWLGFRAGKIKLPYGLYNESRDIDALRTAVLMPQGVYDQRFRDLLVGFTGAAIYGTTPYRSWGAFDYIAMGGSTNMATDGPAASALNSEGFGVFTVGALQVEHVAGGALVWNAPTIGLRAGASITHVHWGADYVLSEGSLAALAPLGGRPVESMESKNTRLITDSLELTVGDLMLAAEYSIWLGDLESRFLYNKMDRESWYGLASYRINEWLEAGTYYSVFYPDADDRDGRALVASDPAVPRYRAYQKDWTTSLRFDMSDFWILKGEVHFIRGTGSLLANDNLADGDEHWILFTAKTSFVF